MILNELIDACQEYADMEGSEIGDLINSLCYPVQDLDFLPNAHQHTKNLLNLLLEIINHMKIFEDQKEFLDWRKKYYNKIIKFVEEF